MNLKLDYKPCSLYLNNTSLKACNAFQIPKKQAGELAFARCKPESLLLGLSALKEAV